MHFAFTLPPLLSVSLIGALCIGAQWVAWRFRLPAIVLLSIVGLVLGPVTGALDPETLFGEHLHTLIAIAVAIILFDGGLGLRFKELKEIKRAVLQMVLIGAPLAWVLTAAACHYIGGISIPVSVVFGGILVVTGPTVILPLLRSAGLQPRTAALLKWEGIINDPIGALFAVIALQYFSSASFQQSPTTGFMHLAAAIILIMLCSWAMGKLMEQLFQRGHIPEFLKQPFVLIMVILTYAIANLIQKEGGLVAVTVLGITLANSKLPNLDEMRRFKEHLSLILVSLVFVFITATLRWEDIQAIDWRGLLFIASLLLLIRPVTVFFSMLRSGITWKEGLFVGWIAPRGIVCAAVSGLLGPELVAAGYPDGSKMIPLAFGIVFATILCHGFSLRPWGMRLGLVYEKTSGLLIVGCNLFTVALAEHLKTLDIPVIIADRNWHHLRLARQAQIPCHYGEILSEAAEYSVEMGRYKTLLAATDNPAYNQLLASRFAHEFGHEQLFQLRVEHLPQDKDKASKLAKHVPHILDNLLYDEIIEHMENGWKIKTVRITEEHPLSAHQKQYGEQMQPLLTLTDKKIAICSSDKNTPLPEHGYTLLCLIAANQCAVKE